ncbi:MAG: cellulase family glycosylhydrolase [Candidatus Lokiarchaeota archaeon]|nr:cellulase family glycosylhydrolase [Candidatus Lokiarchaeota archaeon]
MKLKIKNEWFIDDEGRTVLLRGVNLGGSSKVPFSPNGATHFKTDFSDHRNVSFVGRPFPLKEAEEHFSRLKHWGFNCLRFLVTWEAVEHSGPGEYDKEYLDYLEEVLKIAESYSFYTFVDPHQDVWSRMSGGDGAPGWTFEKVGLDITKFDTAEAALVMQYRYNPNDPKSYPHLHWISNSLRFANGTIWTLFFGGKHFAPSCKIDGINAQEYLQNHYYNAFKQVAIRIKDNPYIIGFDSLNEPYQGWIERLVDGSDIEGFSEALGYVFKPIDAMLTGAGYTRTIPYREIKRLGIKVIREDEMNKNGISCWLDGHSDIWKEEGVWHLNDEGDPIILKNKYFKNRNGKEVDFFNDYLTPFIAKYTKIIREIIPKAIIFFEGPAEELMKSKEINFDVPKNVVQAGHWYDGATLGKKRPMIKVNFNTFTNKPVIGRKNVRDMFINQLGIIKNISSKIHGGIPTLIGEFGLPFNLNNGEAYQKYKLELDIAWKSHIKLLSMYYDALDANLLHSTQWNYTADNTNEWGDLWNLEDLSIFSRDQQLNPNDINSGGRAIEGFCRPHFIHCSGIPLKTDFTFREKTFNFEFDADSSIEAPTIIYVPHIQYPNGYKIKVSDGDIDKKDAEQLVFLRTKKNGVHAINITKIP